MQKPTIKYVKKTPAHKAAGPLRAGTTTTDFILLDIGNQQFQIQGVDAAGNPTDLSTTFVITASVSDSTTATCSVSGTIVTLTAVGPLTVPGMPNVLTVTATAIPPLVAGPFNATLDFDVVTSPTTGIVPVPIPSSITIH